METQDLKSKKPVNSPFTVKETSKKKEFECKPTAAFISASWTALFIGMVAYCIGLWNVDSHYMELNEKGYYFTILLFGLFSVVSVQKSVRDRLEGIPVTDIYYGISWFTTIASILLLIIGLWNATIDLSEKGFYGMAFALSLFAAVAVQKNTRDVKFIERVESK
ncbi:MAG: inner membrane protein YiaA [Gilvibacter sp.]